MSPTTTSPESNKTTSEAGFTSYPSYKPPGLDWLAEIPESWSAPRLGFVTEVNPPKGSIRDEREDYPVSFIPMEAIGEGGGLDLSSEKPLSEVVDGYTYFEDGDVLVAKITPCFENGKGALPRNLASGVGFGTTELHVLRPGDDIDERFLFYLTISDHFRKLGEASMYGAAGQKRVPEEFVFGFRHPLPPLQEQRGIASFLNQSTSRIDRLIAKKERLIELLEERRTALITKAVTKGLDPDVPMKDSGVEWLGEIPEHWGVISLQHTIKRQQTGSTPSTNQSRYYSSEDVPWYGPSSFNNQIEIGEPSKWIAETAIKEGAAPLFPAHSILIGTIASIGEVGLLPDPGSSNQQITGLIPNQEVVEPRFLAYQLRSRKGILKSLASKTTMPIVNQTELGNLSVTVPPLGEQREIIGHLDSVSSTHKRLREHLEIGIDLLQEYRSALITAAVTGKIDVRDQAA